MMDIKPIEYFYIAIFLYSINNDYLVGRAGKYLCAVEVLLWL